MGDGGDGDSNGDVNWYDFDGDGIAETPLISGAVNAGFELDVAFTLTGVRSAYLLGRAAFRGAAGAIASVSRSQSAARGVINWIGPGGSVHFSPSGNFILTSRDGLRRFRIDFVQDAGRIRGPHAQLEQRAFTNRPFGPARGTPRHIYFEGQ